MFLKQCAVVFLRGIFGVGTILIVLLAVSCGNANAEEETHHTIKVIQEYTTPHMKCSVVEGGIHLNHHVFSANSASDLNYKNINHCRQEMLQQKKSVALRSVQLPLVSVSNNQMLCSFVVPQSSIPHVRVVFFEKQPSDFDATLEACVSGLREALLLELKHATKSSGMGT
jgi:hypothetical protein